MTRLALVTGGCRRIGAAIAARLARDGAALALHAHDHDTRPEAGLAAMLAECGTDWALFPADLGNAAAVDGLLPAIAARFGRVPHILVNCASRFGQDDPASLTADAMLGHYAVNTVAPALLSAGVAAAAGPGRPAVIVNILDQRIAHPHGDQLSYTLSKLALAEMTTIAARQFAPHVRVCGVAPGLTLPTEDYAAGQMTRMAARMPLERLAVPDEIADAVAWLVGAGSVTGQVIFVDGGAHLAAWERDFLFMD